ncbi:hypothetical protein BDV35DRAFT_394723 [Aspergillus flavus]|uniref:Uncharacterized protein n=1 Tax=Aspergillus flavus TaxID=5059 RepID=A0A5N6GVY1_ASPFL|nr:hypothetical protein BDV35DRAFT_394723 [Aspergillus flavus]
MHHKSDVLDLDLEPQDDEVVVSSKYDEAVSRLVKIMSDSSLRFFAQNADSSTGQRQRTYSGTEYSAHPFTNGVRAEFVILEEFGKCRLWGPKPPFGPRLALEVAVPHFVVVALLLSAAVVPVSLGGNIFV